jgi:cobalt/nickel transport system permease protein
MFERRALAAYLVCVLMITLWHEPFFHLAVGVIAFILGGRARVRLLGRALFALLFFSGGVSLGFIILAWWENFSPWDYLWRLNLRVLVLTLLSFVFIARVNLFRALSFSKDLSYVLVIATGQIDSLRKLYQDFRLAWRSRTLVRLGWRAQQQQVSALGLCMLEKSLHRSKEITQAMRSRGFFDGLD